MIIDITKLEDAQWVEYREGFDLLIRPLSSSKRSEIEKKATTLVTKFVKGRRQQVSELDSDKMEELLLDWIIKDWRGLVNPDKNKIACDLATKLLIFDYFHDMRRFAIEEATTIHEKIKEKEENDSKN